MKQINWDTTEEDDVLIESVVKRAFEELELDAIIDKTCLSMDIAVTHLNGTPLDFNKLLSFDDFNFGHDVYGISSNINRNTGKLDNCFLPRCSKHN